MPYPQHLHKPLTILLWVPLSATERRLVKDHISSASGTPYTLDALLDRCRKPDVRGWELTKGIVYIFRQDYIYQIQLKLEGFPSILASKWETRKENQSPVRETEAALSVFK